MMGKLTWVALILCVGICAFGVGEDRQYPYRWVYASSRLADEADLERVKGVVQTAADHGLNGILLSCGADRLDMQSDEYLGRLLDLKSFAQERGVEIIPSIFSTGYGGSLLAHNRNLAAGLPVKDALLVAKGDKAEFHADSPEGLKNGSFEQHDGAKVIHFEYEATKGGSIQVDEETIKEGKASLRFEVTGDRSVERSERGLSVSQVFAVKPHRTYRVSAWVKSEGMDPSRPFGSGNLRIKSYAAEDDHQLDWININAPASGDWFKVHLGFNSLGYDTVRIRLGSSGESVGKFWIDDLQVAEVGLVNVLRRPGTPVTIRSETGGTEYEEGRDYEPVSDPELNFRWNRESRAVKLVAGGRIKPNERLRISYYHGTHVYNGQTPVCMSEPQVYEIWRKNARLMQEKVGFKSFFFHMDEIRAGGTCAACKARNLPMKEIFGDCVTRAHNIIREVAPDAEIFIWSDMLDPNHNASTRRPYYFHVPETFDGSWEFVPRDLVIACWNFRIRDKSLKHFSDLGHRTIAAAYYDADDLENPRGWLEALSRTPDASGIMYTTWLRKYDLLADFGDLVSKARKSGH